jgi:hypothetical protein
MREPTSNAQALRWYWRALSDKALHLPLAIDYDEPHCGWYLTRVVKGGPFCPARIFLEQEVSDEGELLSDEVLKCEINGQPRDAYEVWIWLASEPITEAEFNYMVKRGEYARTWQPDEPAANSYTKINWKNVPTPKFT